MSDPDEGEEWQEVDDIQLLNYGRDRSHPAFVAFWFVITAHRDGDDVLGFVTPASRARWDFEELRRKLAEIPDRALSSEGVRVEGARDVATVRIVAGEPTMRNTGGGLVIESGRVLLIWHEDAGSWLVHAVLFGTDSDGSMLEGLPRPNPGVGPDF